MTRAVKPPAPRGLEQPQAVSHAPDPIPVGHKQAAAPSIASRLGRALALWALVWGAAVGIAVWLAAASEVDELLDQGLMSSAALLSALPGSLGVAQASAGPGPAGSVTGTGTGANDDAAGAAARPDALPKNFAWQLVASDGRLLQRSSLAPAQPWHATPRAGFSNQDGWRLYGLAVPAGDGPTHTLYAAQTRSERSEVRAEVGLSAALSALAVGLLGQIWLRARVRAELQPLQRLTDRLGQLDFGAGDSQARLGVAERRELAPVHAAVDGLMTRLSGRIGNERAFTAHAAHALRTPLAGIDAQLALALRDASPQLGVRLQRVRDAAGRLQGVVAALLGLFRAGTALDRVPVSLPDLLARLPTASLAVALMNLLDNSQRHGASQAHVCLTAAQTLRVHDDGPGVDVAQRQRLQQAMDQQAYEGHTGLGMMLADRVARAHGGSVVLSEVRSGFAVELKL